MMINIIKKLETYSLAKQFWVLFFIATLDAWVMPLATAFLCITGLYEADFFQASYAEFLWRNNAGDLSPILITEPAHYYIYIYIFTGELSALHVSGWGTPVVILNIFHIISFALFLTLLIRCNLPKNKKYFYSALGIITYYGIGFLTMMIYLFFILVLGSMFPDVFV